MSDFHTLQLADKEMRSLQDMLQHYREFQEELYQNHDNPEILFTSTQRQLFTKFDVVSIKYTR
jgi:hypothetical protein